MTTKKKTAKNPPLRKALARQGKTAAKKTTVKKPPPKKPVARKTSAKKSPPKSTPRKKAAEKKAPVKQRSKKPVSKARKKVSSSGIPSFVSSYIELGKFLGVSRQALSRWSKIDGSPKAKSDGRHSLKEWSEFMKANDLAGKSNDLNVLKARDLLAKCEEREFKNSVKRGEYVSVEEVRLSWSSLTAKALQMLEKSLLDELPPILAGKDPLGIRVDLENQLNEVRQILHKGEGLTP